MQNLWGFSARIGSAESLAIKEGMVVLLKNVICGGKSKLENNFVLGQRCRRYRTKQQQQHLLLLTKRDTKFLQPSKEIEERKLHSEDLAE